MKINLRIEYSSGEAVEASATAPDLVAFEDKFNLSVTKLEAEMKVTHLLWIAWHSLYRKKSTDKEFDVWVEFVESIEPSTIDPKSKGQAKLPHIGRLPPSLAKLALRLACY